MFTKNIGLLDRMARVVIGASLLGAALSGATGSWAFIGVIPLITAAVGNCPLYSSLGIRTCKLPQSGS
jgi:hypothetical protein